jgi:diguanylate cyclase (GGDEF)-like protein
MNRRHRIFNVFVFRFLLFLLWVSLALALMALDPDKTITQYTVRVWNMESGLPGNTVYALRQTQEGYLWIGTPDGLVRFDGINFELYTTKNVPQLKSNVIRALYEDRHGTLWIGTESGGLTRCEKGEFSTYPITNHGALNRISAINEDRWGNLWIGSRTGGLTCLSLSSDKLTTYTTKQGLPNNEVKFIYKDGNGDLWVATTAGIVKLLKPGIFRIYASKKNLPHSMNVCLYEEDTSTRDLWIGTFDSGLTRLRNGKFVVYGAEKGVPHPTITYIYKDGMKNLWIGTDGGGLTRKTNGVFSTLPGNDGLADGFVYSINEDREGSLWVGTIDGGLHQLRDSKFTTITTREGLVHDYVDCIYEGRGGDLWIGTRGGLSRLKNGKVTTVLTTGQGLLNNQVLAIFEDRSGYLWVGTRGGLHRCKDGKPVPLTKKHGLSDNRITCIWGDREGNTWIGTENGLNRYNRDSDDFSIFTANEGLLSNFIEVIYEDRRGNLWIATDAGLHTFDNGVISVYDPDGHLEYHHVRCAYEDREGMLWFGTDHGLIRLRENETTRYNVHGGLIENKVYSILEDEKSHLWLAGRNGISRISKKALEDFSRGKIPQVHPDWFNEKDGMKSRWCTDAGCKTRDGKFWFPTGVGVAVIDPDNIITNRLAPPIIIEKLVVDGEAVNVNTKTRGKKPLELGPGKKRLEFYYTAASFINPQRITFKLKLVGYDRDWLDIGTSRSTNYTGLPPGHYTFRVIACNADGVWNENGASFSFYLKPYFTQTTWFYLLLAICVVVIVFMGFHLRVRQFRAREEKLRLLVDRQTKDLIEAKEMAIKANQSKSEFLSNMSHDIRTPLNAILGFADILDKELKDRRQSEYLSAIRSSGKTLLGLIDDILDLGRIEAGRLVLQYTPVDLRTIFKEIQSIFTAKLDEKGLDFKIEMASGFPEILMLDETRIRQVLFNLVGNAVKFTPSGYVKISASSRPRENKKENNGNRVDFLFSVEDTGIGIPGDQLERIFGAFIQKEGQAQAVYGGSGLGLAVTGRLVERMGGTISVTSKEGHGSNFQVCIRGVEKTSDNELLETARKGAGIDIDAVVFKNARILIVDDLKQNRDLLKAYLNDYPGLELLEAGGGKEAVKLSKHQHPDVILMDMVMPVIDGFQAAKMIKSDETLKDIPVIAVTASVMKREEIKYRSMCDDLLKKPLDKTSLILKLTQFLDYAVLESEAPVSSAKDGREPVKTAVQVKDPAKGKKAGKHDRILIVDDSPQNIKLLGMILKDEGYRINVAQDGMQALKMVEKVSPDLILLDIMMPGMNGYETCKKLKGNSETRDIPVIFLSARVEPGDVVTGFEIGGADYITKPFNESILLARVKTHIALVKKRKQLRDMSQKDGLTMIANRRRFDEFLQLEWRRCLRNQCPITVIMIDIDHFKAYNDFYGHLQGDEVLRKVAGILEGISQRPGDLAARYGGEEFAVILGNTDEENARRLAQKMCRQIEQQQIPHEKSGVSNVVTASIGAATVIPGADSSPVQLLESADKRLYEAKKEGRNQAKTTIP